MTKDSMPSKLLNVQPKYLSGLQDLRVVGKDGAVEFGGLG